MMCFNRYQALLVFFLSFALLVSGCKVNGTENSFKNGYESVGCGHFTVYIVEPEGNRVLKIRYNLPEAKLVQENKIELPSSVVQVTYVEYQTSVKEQLCNDVVQQWPKKVEEAIVRKGQLKIVLDDIAFENYKAGRPFAVNLFLTNLKFGEGKEKVFGDKIKIENVIVGFMPG